MSLEISHIDLEILDHSEFMVSMVTKNQNIGNHGYIGTWILRIY